MASTSAVDAEYNAIRARLAKGETPAVLITIAALVVLLSSLNYLMHPNSHPGLHLLDFAAALVLAGFGLVLRRSRIPAPAARWAFALCMVLLVASLAVQARVDPAASPAFVLIAIVLIGPLTMAWPPFLLGAGATVIAMTIATWSGPNDGVLDWTFTAMTAVLASAVLLYVRLRSLREQAVAVVRANEMATTDPLTGVLNRRGLEEVLPTFSATAKRLLLPISVYFIDVDGLKNANDAHGHAFGDEILQGVANALRSTVRAGDLVARWGGDEFVVVGIGQDADHTAFESRLGHSIRWGGLDLNRWCGTVSVGSASGALEPESVEEFITRADADMYGQRSRRRDITPGQGVN